jgi:hypothetical protein
MQKKNKLCPFCRICFVASAFIHNQVYCCNSNACQRKSHRVASKKYRDKVKNTAEFKQQEKARVTKWRSENPRYWCRKPKKNSGKIISEIALRDLASPQNSAIEIALRDLAFSYEVKFKGLISILFDPLRDSIDDLEKEVYNRGQELLKDSNPSYLNFKLTETEHEKRVNSP